jgi:hypothetical protein
MAYNMLTNFGAIPIDVNPGIKCSLRASVPKGMV